MEITKEKFEAFLRVRDSGATNMFDVPAVVKLSRGVLVKEDCTDIMKNFAEYEKKFEAGEIKPYIVRFSGIVRVKAKDKDEAIELVTNEMILDNIAMDEAEEE